MKLKFSDVEVVPAIFVQPSQACFFHEFNRLSFGMADQMFKLHHLHIFKFKEVFPGNSLFSGSHEDKEFK